MDAEDIFHEPICIEASEPQLRELHPLQPSDLLPAVTAMAVIMNFAVIIIGHWIQTSISLTARDGRRSSIRDTCTSQCT